MWEYPFAVAGVNITFMLIQMLDLEAGYFTSPFSFLVSEYFMYKRWIGDAFMYGHICFCILVCWHKILLVTLALSSYHRSWSEWWSVPHCNYKELDYMCPRAYFPYPNSIKFLLYLKEWKLVIPIQWRRPTLYIHSPLLNIFIIIFCILYKLFSLGSNEYGLLPIIIFSDVRYH